MQNHDFPCKWVICIENHGSTPHRGSISISESDQGLHKPSEIEFSHRILMVYQKPHWKTLISDKVTALKRSEIPSTKYQGFPTIKKKRPYLQTAST